MVLGKHETTRKKKGVEEKTQTSSENAETEEENDATQIAAQTGLVWAIDGNLAGLVFLLRLPYYHHVF